MPVLTEDYKPRLLFKNGHINTIYPYVTRKKLNLPFDRQRFITSDDDFVDLDWLHQSDTKKLVILCHGLEGSSESHYMMYNSDMMFRLGWNVMCFNYRSCSGEMNKNLQMYHSGWTTDLHEIISSIEDNYDEISLLGFSLGANMILKYVNDGIYQVSKKIKSIVAISTPADLSKSCAKMIERKNFIYDIKFRQTLVEKIKQKYEMFPNHVPVQDLKKVKSLRDFDEYFTGPMNGFSDAEDYYAKCNCKQFLHRTSIPTLMITAEDDPFFTRHSLPYDIAKETELLFFMPTKFGGHVGFTTFGSNYYWNEHKTKHFFENPHDFVGMYNIVVQ